MMLDKILERGLTPTQNRRIRKRYGLDGEEHMSVRQMARGEGVNVKSVHESLEGALKRLSSNPYVWLMWLLLPPPGPGNNPQHNMKGRRTDFLWNPEWAAESGSGSPLSVWERANRR